MHVHKNTSNLHYENHVWFLRQFVARYCRLIITCNLDVFYMNFTEFYMHDMQTITSFNVVCDRLPRAITSSKLSMLIHVVCSFQNNNIQTTIGYYRIITEHMFRQGRIGLDI